MMLCSTSISLLILYLAPSLPVIRAGPIIYPYHYPNKTSRNDVTLISQQSGFLADVIKTKRHSYDDGSYKQDEGSYYHNDWEQSSWNSDDNQRDWKDDSTDDHQWTSSHHDWESSKTTTSTLSTAWSSATTSSSSTWLSPIAYTTPAAPSIPLTIPTPTAGLSPERISLISGQILKARQRAVDGSKIMSSNPLVMWQVPKPGDGFTAGQQITLQWSSTLFHSMSLNLRLCLLRSNVDLQNAQNGMLSQDGSCGASILVNSTVSADGQTSLLSFGAPILQNADSYYIALSPPLMQYSPQQNPTQAAWNAGAAPTLSPWQPQRRDLDQIISPSFVLAPRGIDMSVLNALIPASPSATALAAQTQINQPIQQQQLANSGKARPIAWSWILGPILLVATVLIVGALIYCHRQGQKRARTIAEEKAKEGEERWREATRREVANLTEKTATQSILCGVPPSYQSYSAFLPRSSNSVMSQPSTVNPMPLMQKVEMHGPYLHAQPSETASLHRQSSHTTSTTSSSKSGSVHLPYLRSEKEDRAQNVFDAYERHSQALLERDASMRSQYSQYPILTPLPIPVALRPRHSIPRSSPSAISMVDEAAIPNPFEARTSRETSTSTRVSTRLTAEAEKGGRGRILSHGAAERSATTGKIGTPFDFVGQDLIDRADQANDVYSQLKQALQRPQ